MEPCQAGCWRGLDPQRLSRWEKAGLVVLVFVTVAFGGIVELRSAFLKRPMTDLQVYLRASWAVRTGADFYAITDENDWHYHYPPLFAILLAPLADAPAGVERTGLLPFAVTVGLWYVFSVLCLALAVHLVASALEATALLPELCNPPRGSRRWWALRIIPVLVGLPGIGGTLARGQVNLLLLLLLCGMIAAAVRGRRGHAGLWLAGAICLKVIPAYLLVYPLWRRDWRWLAGCGAGLVAGLAVVPAVVFGPERALAYYQEWHYVLVRPGLGDTNDRSRATELTEVTATDNQSFVATLHNAMYPDKFARPAQASADLRRIHWLIAGVLTLLTLGAAGQPRRADGPATTIVLGALIVLMVLSSPVCHLHYFCVVVPLVMGVVAAGWEQNASLRLGRGLVVLLVVHTLANILPRLPAWYAWRDRGLAMYAALLLWLAGCIILRQRRASVGGSKGELMAGFSRAVRAS